MKKKKTIISIVGETATGKTEAAFQLAESLIEKKACAGVDIISADSRQVYADIPILSGADVPDGFVKKNLPGYLPFLEKGLVRLHGVGILAASEEWSLGQFQEFALKLIDRSEIKNRSVIIVGGTGLYHTQLFQTEDRLRVPPNTELREKAEELSVEELQVWLSQVDPARFERMNESDRANPRRLVRAIEQGFAKDSEKPDAAKIKSYNHKIIGIRRESSQLQQNIGDRVRRRFENGAIEEVEKLRKEPSLASGIETTLGFENIGNFLDGEITADECVRSWTVNELQYAKRQRTWWRPIDKVEWADDVKALNMYTEPIC
ncbi:MAG: hypothetical protein COY80_00435 [Candidatus Pacebacteria bacterium CG_4_10_14_0_8_um_filter_42_14]|nr:MAG: hypothetical protein COY80_00435 [Candidatus Pacebacteria bacterium CG_4_10_14_0_8_um_filter_42_14]